jgi:hypothetical protein
MEPWLLYQRNSKTGQNKEQLKLSVISDITLSHAFLSTGPPVWQHIGILHLFTARKYKHQLTTSMID